MSVARTVRLLFQVRPTERKPRPTLRHQHSPVWSSPASLGTSSRNLALIHVGPQASQVAPTSTPSGLDATMVKLTRRRRTRYPVVRWLTASRESSHSERATSPEDSRPWWRPHGPHGAPTSKFLRALGHGRSYGAPSRLVVRTLPGILQSGVWQTLSSLPAAKTRALVTDVGNDILYGFPAARILEWVGEAVDRLQRIHRRISCSPICRCRPSVKSPGRSSCCSARCSRLSAGCLWPRSWTRPNGSTTACHLSPPREGFNSCTMKSEWYGVDPIHIRPSLWRPAWQQILGCDAERSAGARDVAWRAMRLYVHACGASNGCAAWSECRLRPASRWRAGGRCGSSEACARPRSSHGLCGEGLLRRRAGLGTRPEINAHAPLIRAGP